MLVVVGDLLIFLSRAHLLKAAEGSPITRAGILVGSYINLVYVYIRNPLYLQVLKSSAANSVGFLRVCLWRAIADFGNV